MANYIALRIAQPRATQAQVSRDVRNYQFFAFLSDGTAGNLLIDVDRGSLIYWSNDASGSGLRQHTLSEMYLSVSGLADSSRLTERPLSLIFPSMNNYLTTARWHLRLTIKSNTKFCPSA